MEIDSRSGSAIMRTGVEEDYDVDEGVILMPGDGEVGQEESACNHDGIDESSSSSRSIGRLKDPSKYEYNDDGGGEFTKEETIPAQDESTSEATTFPPKTKKKKCSNSNVTALFGSIEAEQQRRWEEIQNAAKRNQNSSFQCSSASLSNTTGAVESSSTSMAAASSQIPPAPLGGTVGGTATTGTSSSSPLSYDLMLAEMLQSSQDFNMKIDGLLLPSDTGNNNEDAVLAQFLQADEYGAMGETGVEQRQQQDTTYMMQTNTGKAVLFVKELIETIQEIHAATSDPTDISQSKIQNIARDDLVFMTERLLDTQELFVKNGKPYQIDLGYHYTKEQTLERIRTDGLLTRKDQQEQQNDTGNTTAGGGVYQQSRTHRILRGAGYFGDGVYTANNPFSFNHFGPVGLLVARLKGRCIVRGRQAVRVDSEVERFDTVIGNKGSHGDVSKNEIVLRTSSQALPLIRFPKSVLPPGQFAQPQNVDTVLTKFRDAAQLLIDKYFNTPYNSAVSRDLVYAESVIGSSWSPSFQNFPQATTTVSSVATVTSHAQGLPYSHPDQRRDHQTPHIIPPEVAAGHGSGTSSRDMQMRQNNPGFALYIPNNQQPYHPPPSFGATAQSPTASIQPIPPVQRGAGTTASDSNKWLFRTWSYKAPDRLFDVSDISDLDSICVPITEGSLKEDCPICMDRIVPAMATTKNANSWNLGCKLKACGHAIHVCCLSQALQTSNKCPVCRVCVNKSKPQGTSPSGTMNVAYSAFSAFPTQFEGYRAIQITYTLEGGIQKSYHESSGRSYRGDRRVAYLPDSPEGIQLLKRLIFAFRHGLTFRIGTSLTTGRTGCITWASVHHKTSCRPGPHGYPDPDYFKNCNTELDELCVPRDPDVSIKDGEAA